MMSAHGSWPWPTAMRLLSATWKSTRLSPAVRIARAQSASSMFMWKMSSATPQLPPTSFAIATAWSARLMK